MSSERVRIEPAGEADTAVIHAMVEALAEHLELSHYAEKKA